MKTMFKIITVVLTVVCSTAYANSGKLATDITQDKIRDFILNNPEIILESLKRYEEKIRVVERVSTENIIRAELTRSKDGSADYIGGNQDGSITMIEFLDYRCGYCRKAHYEVKRLLKNNSDVRFIIKEFPILGEQSLIAAKASIAVLIHQGKDYYEDFTEKLLNYKGTINIKSISHLIESIGGDFENIKLRMEAKVVHSVLTSNYLLAEKLNISGTPTFIIGTEIIRGYKDINTLQELINIERQNL